MSLFTFRQMEAPNGLPGFRVWCGAAVLGTAFNLGPRDTTGDGWAGVTPDGTRFTAASRQKLADKLAGHGKRAQQQEGKS